MKAQEEVYYFVKGHGTMELDDKKIKVDPGDVVLIEDGVFSPVLVNKAVILFVCLTEKESLMKIGIAGYGYVGPST